MKTYMFPGQGSQVRGMGGDLFDKYSELTEKADKILGYSIKELCLEDPRRELSQTQFTQPALYVVNALSYFDKVEQSGKPDYVVGHSLGEFNALLAAECFDFEVGLTLVKKRGELMSQTTDGAMAAILNANVEQVKEILAKNNLNNIDLANYNSPAQIVISGETSEIQKAQEFFQFDRVMYYPLNTSGAFHSRFMKPAAEKFTTYLKQFNFSELQIPVIANVSALPYDNNQILENLSSQIASTVRWSDSILYLMQLDSAMEFIEVGYGDVLTKLVHYIKTQTASAAKKNAKAAHTKIEKQIVPKITQSADKSASNISLGTDVQAKVIEWNKCYSIGTKVKSTVINDDNLETSTEAVVLFGHRAAVYMKGYNGYFDLNEVVPA